MLLMDLCPRGVDLGQRIPSRPLSVLPFLACIWWYIIYLFTSTHICVSFHHNVNPMREKSLPTCPWLHPQLPAQFVAYSKCLVNSIHWNEWRAESRLWGCRMLLLPVWSLDQSLDGFWEFAGDPEPQTPPPTYCIKICILTRFPDDSVGMSQFREH